MTNFKNPWGEGGIHFPEHLAAGKKRWFQDGTDALEKTAQGTDLIFTYDYLTLAPKTADSDFKELDLFDQAMRPLFEKRIVNEVDQISGEVWDQSGQGFDHLLEIIGDDARISMLGNDRNGQLREGVYGNLIASLRTDNTSDPVYPDQIIKTNGYVTHPSSFGQNTVSPVGLNYPSIAIRILYNYAVVVSSAKRQQNIFLRFQIWEVKNH
jgi:hypothetical protein